MSNTTATASAENRPDAAPRKPRVRVTKRSSAASELASMAARLGPGARLPTFDALRRELGVSVTTLSSALEEMEGRGVLRRRHGVGIYVAESLGRRTLLVLCEPMYFRERGGEEASPFWQLLIEHVRQHVRAGEDHLIVSYVRPREEGAGGDDPLLPDSVIADLTAGRVHGVLGIGLTPPTVKWLEARKVPLVAFAGWARHFVAIDSAATARLGAEELVAQGCRRIAYWTAAHPSPGRTGPRPGAAAAWQAFAEILTAHGIEPDESLVVGPADWPIDEPLPTRQEQGRRAAGALFGPGSDPVWRPDGVFCAEDMMMQGALPALLRMGVRPGEDVQIATHANAGSPVLFGYEDVLTRIEVDPSRLAAEMCGLLDAQMDGGAAEGMPEAAVYLPPTVRRPEAPAPGGE